MPLSEIVIAELNARIAQLELRRAQMNLSLPSEGDAAKSRRYRERRRLACMADDYRRLVELAQTHG